MSFEKKRKNRPVMRSSSSANKPKPIDMEVLHNNKFYCDICDERCPLVFSWISPIKIPGDPVRVTLCIPCFAGMLKTLQDQRLSVLVTTGANVNELLKDVST